VLLLVEVMGLRRGELKGMGEVAERGEENRRLRREGQHEYDSDRERDWIRIDVAGPGWSTDFIQGV